MFKKVYKILILSIFLVFTLSTLGVYATWRFAENPAYGDKTFGVIMAEYHWSGSDDLPHEVQGEDHAWLIVNLVDGQNSSGKDIGLNNPNSAINDYVNDRLDGGIGWSRDYFGSMAVTGGSDMADLFGTKAKGLSFIIEVLDDLHYNIYTTSINLGERGSANWLGTSNSTPGKPNIPIGEYIYPIYKTVLTRTSTSEDWTIVETKRGKAKSDWYDENRRNANVTQIPSFDVKTWAEAELGKSPDVNNAIYTYVGDTPTAYATTSMPEVFYRIVPTSSKTITVSTDNELCLITVFDNTGAQIAQSPIDVNENGKIAVSFSATAGQTYYLSIQGDHAMLFAIQ